VAITWVRRTFAPPSLASFLDRSSASRFFLSSAEVLIGRRQWSRSAFCVCVKPRWWMAAAAPGSVRICSSGAALCGCAQHHASFRHRGLQHPPLHFCRERAMRDFITIAACLGAAAADHTDFDGWNAGQITSVRCVLTFRAHRVSPGAFLAPRWCSAWRSSRLCRSQEPELQITFQVENCENCECRKQGTGQKRGPEGADLKGNCPRVHKIISIPVHNT
jgi:hypothetical protein